MTHLLFESELPCSQQHLYDYHACGVAFQRLVAPWENITLRKWLGGEATSHLPPMEQFGDISKGAEVHLTVHQGPIGLPLVAKHTDHQEPNGFTDTQIQGPFSKWEHQHRFILDGHGSSRLVDEIHFQGPGFGLLDWYFSSIVRRTFHYRHQRTKMDIESHQRYAHHPKKKIVISGASGLIGQALDTFLRTGGHTVLRLVRRSSEDPNDIYWNIKKGEIDASKLEGVDAVVHLAGESIDGRWTKDKKNRIQQSRALGTSLLAETLSKLETPPEVFVSTSAVGAYGNHPTDIATENTPMANDFLGNVCQVWESSASMVQSRDIRLVHPRFGVVLSGRGGALKKMLPPFLAGAGGKVGSGTQWMPWIALDDVVGILFDMIMSPKWSGPVNVVAPNPVQNAEFTKVLGRVLSRPTVLPVPAFAIRTMFGEMGQTLVLEGRHVQSNVLPDSGYPFHFPDLESALRFELGRESQVEQS